jgi:hypothetical protein
MTTESLSDLVKTIQDVQLNIEKTSWDDLVTLTRYRRLISAVLKELTMSKTTKSNFANALTMQDRQEKATKQAREHLADKGITYPYYDSSLSQEENYGRMLAYAEQEAALVVNYMRQPSGDRPLVLDNTEPKKDWGSYYDR